MADKEKTYVEDVNRSLYDFRNVDEDVYKVEEGLTAEIVRQISKEKNDPEWMLEHRLKSLEIYNNMQMKEWGPPIDGLHMDNIVTYIKPKDNKMSADWEEVPEEIKDTFERLGIPQAERESLAGVGAQYDSELVYHNVREEVAAMGVVYTDLESAMHGEYGDMIREHFMKLITPQDHKFAALHGAVWSGGSFVYVPAGAKVEIPLQSYFRLNAPGAGQFEHTLIIVDEGAELHYMEGCTAPTYSTDSLHAAVVEIFVGKNAKCRYTTIQNWSNNVYNLVTKRALVDENGLMEWIDGNIGSKVNMKYPSCILSGKGAKGRCIAIAVATKDQIQDAGARMIHLAPNTESEIISKSIAANGGEATYRGKVKITKEAVNSKSIIKCDTILLDSESRSDTVPDNVILNESSTLNHEATVSKIDKDKLFYLMSRGISEDKAKELLIMGFIDRFREELPMEYAVELNALLKNYF